MYSNIEKFTAIQIPYTEYIEGKVRIVCDQFHVIPVVKDPFIIRFLEVQYFVTPSLAGEGFTKPKFLVLMKNAVNTAMFGLQEIESLEIHTNVLPCPFKSNRKFGYVLVLPSKIYHFLYELVVVSSLT